MEYTTENHSKSLDTDASVHLVMVHLIFVCKYRKHLPRYIGSQSRFYREIYQLVRTGDYIKNAFHSVAEKHKFEIVEMEVDKDHIHLLVKYPPTKSILDMVRLLKQISTFEIWRSGHSGYLSEHLWKVANPENRGENLPRFSGL